MRTIQLNLDSADLEVIREALTLLRDFAEEDARLSIDQGDVEHFQAESTLAENLLQRVNALTDS
jgi:hypothetical protein